MIIRRTIHCINLFAKSAYINMWWAFLKKCPPVREVWLCFMCCSFPPRHCGSPSPPGDESVTEWILWGHLRKCDRKRWWIIIYCSVWIASLKGVPAETSGHIRPVNRTVEFLRLIRDECFYPSHSNHYDINSRTTVRRKFDIGATRGENL
jgi:hypothetical protein